MKKQLAATAVAMLGVLSFQVAANADTWFDKYDHNHDGHWNYSEFHNAHRDWERRHTEEHRMTERELHAKFHEYSHAHPGWVAPEEVREFHHWD